MANMHLVTGYAGREHVTAADQGAFHAAVIGGGEFVLGTGNQFAASIVSNNQVRVLDGDIYMQGRFIRLDKDTYIDLAIENGASGYFRNDLIVARYTQNHATAIEEVNLVVIKGEAVMENPEDPAYTAGDILVAGDMQNDMPLYRVVIDGLNLVELVPLFSVYDSNLQKKQERTDLLEEKGSLSDADHFPVFDDSTKKHKKVLLSKIKDFLVNTFAAKSHSHEAGDITSGILPTDRGGMGTSDLSEFAESLGVCRFKVGTYVGTGKSGSSNPCKINLGFVPKLLLIDDVGISQDDKTGASMIACFDSLTSSYANKVAALRSVQGYTDSLGGLYLENYSSYLFFKTDGTYLYWHCTRANTGDTPIRMQCNNSGHTFLFRAFG